MENKIIPKKEKMEYIEIEISQEEIKLKEAQVREMIRSDLSKSFIDMKTKPIIVKVFDGAAKHRGETHYTVVNGRVDTDLPIEVNFSPFPPSECIKRIAHHESAHIIKLIKRGNIGESHDSIFTNILKKLDKDLDKDICTGCPYANKKIYLKKEEVN